MLGTKHLFLQRVWEPQNLQEISIFGGKLNIDQDKPGAGTNGVIFGEILGRNAGEIVADAVFCRFLFPRTPVLDSDLFRRLGSSGERT
jgi:hypothetical protein